jgi:hypothetical protein
MIELKCWGCGWDGRVPDHFEGLRVICKRCGDSNVVPDSVAKEVNVAKWFASTDSASDSVTVEVECSISRSGVPSMSSSLPWSEGLSSIHALRHRGPLSLPARRRTSSGSHSDCTSRRVFGPNTSTSE